MRTPAFHVPPCRHPLRSRREAAFPMCVRAVASVVSDSCDPTDYSPSGSPVHGILQARILEWVAMPSSRGSSPPRDRTLVLLSPALAGGLFTTSATREGLPHVLLLRLSRFSRVRLCATPWTVALQAPLSMGFSRQEYWSGLPFPSPGDLPNPGIKPASPVSPALAGGFFAV